MDENRIAQMLTELPPAPETWVRAARELPALRRQLDTLAELAERDVEFRAALLQDLDRGLRDAGYEPHRVLVDGLRERLGRR